MTGGQLPVGVGVMATHAAAGVAAGRSPRWPAQAPGIPPSSAQQPPRVRAATRRQGVPRAAGSPMASASAAGVHTALKGRMYCPVLLLCAALSSCGSAGPPRAASHTRTVSSKEVVARRRDPGVGGGWGEAEGMGARASWMEQGRAAWSQKSACCHHASSAAGLGWQRQAGLGRVQREPGPLAGPEGPSGGQGPPLGLTVRGEVGSLAAGRVLAAQQRLHLGAQRSHVPHADRLVGGAGRKALRAAGPADSGQWLSGLCACARV